MSKTTGKAMDDQDYRTDSKYIPEYTYFLNPVHMRLSLLMNGLDFPRRQAEEPFRYLELGFGQGVSLNVHAAANDGEFWGVDFIPVHAETAENWAKAARSNCVILNKSFAQVDEMAAGGKLPKFDAVVFHGIWSWVNADNRQHILNIIKQTLKPGGVVYNSYNAMPGWAFFLPVREIMVTLLKRYGEKEILQNRIREMLEYLIAFAESGESAYFSANQNSASYLKNLLKMPPEYLAQEYFNATWRAFYFREAAKDMAQADCRFVTSSALLTQTYAAVRPTLANLIAQAGDLDVIESLRDFATNRKFRMDYFTRSPVKLNQEEQYERLGEMGIKLMKKREDIQLTLKFDYETVDLAPELFDPILDALNDGGRTVKPLRAVIDNQMTICGNKWNSVLECIRIVIGSGLAAAAIPSPSSAAIEASRKLNREFSRQIIEEGKAPHFYLASPVLGAGFKLDFENILLLNAKPANSSDPDLWAKNAVLEIMKHQSGVSYTATFEKMKAQLANLARDTQEDIDACLVSVWNGSPPTWENHG